MLETFFIYCKLSHITDNNDIDNVMSANLLIDNGMERIAPPPVPTQRRPEMIVREEICRGDSVRKACPTKADIVVCIT